MPIYVYECYSCGDKTELIESVTSDPNRVIPCHACEQDVLRRLTFPGGTIGWVKHIPGED